MKSDIRASSATPNGSPRPTSWRANVDSAAATRTSLAGPQDELYHKHTQQRPLSNRSTRRKITSSRPDRSTYCEIPNSQVDRASHCEMPNSQADWSTHCEISASPVDRSTHCEIPNSRSYQIPQCEGSTSNCSRDDKPACDNRALFKHKRYCKSNTDCQREAHYSRSDGSHRLAPLKHRTLMMEGNHIRKELEKEGILSASNNEHEDPDIVLRELRHMGLVKNVRDGHHGELTFDHKGEIQHVIRLPPISAEFTSRVMPGSESQTDTSRVNEEGGQLSNAEQGESDYRENLSESGCCENIATGEDEESETIAKLKYMMFHLDLV